MTRMMNSYDEPDECAVGEAWLDTSTEPPTSKRWTGTEWEVVNAIELEAPEDDWKRPHVTSAGEDVESQERRVEWYDGKYAAVLGPDDVVLRFERHGEPWPAADEWKYMGAITSLVRELDELQVRARNQNEALGVLAQECNDRDDVVEAAARLLAGTAPSNWDEHSILQTRTCVLTGHLKSYSNHEREAKPCTLWHDLNAAVAKALALPVDTTFLHLEHAVFDGVEWPEVDDDEA